MAEDLSSISSLRFFMHMANPHHDRAVPQWEKTCIDKRAEIESQIPRQWFLEDDVRERARRSRQITGSFIEELLDPHTVEITSKDSVSIVTHIRDGKYSSLEVTKAFCERASVAQQISRCLHGMFFAKAFARAKELDDYFTQHGKTMGPLHGLPVSLKDQFHVEGVETFMGYAGWIGTHEGLKDSPKYKTVQSTLVERLLDLGAVLYCKTSCVQTLCISECHNNIIGYNMNPSNQLVSCGGSSGGEGVLQALGGSSIGFGTDQGGSVRIPADFCGVYSIKPSTDRIPYAKVANNNPGQIIEQSTVGVLATSLPSLRLMMSSVCFSRPWEYDTDVIELPWRFSEEHAIAQNAADKSLCFGVMYTDGAVEPHPPVTRSMHLVVEAIQRAGHTVMKWKPPAHDEALSIHLKLGFSDKGNYVAEQISLSDEPLIPEVARFLPTKPVPAIPLLEFQDYVLERIDYRQRYMDYWNSTVSETGTGRMVDGVIMPVAPHAGVRTDHFMYYGYTTVGNVLDYTSVSIPVTHANKKLDPFDESYKPVSDLDEKNWKAYDADIYDGTPVGVQIMGRRLQEERMLSIAGVVVEALESSRQ